MKTNYKIAKLPDNDNQIVDMTREEAIETLQLSLKVAREHLTVIELAKEVMKILSPHEIKEALTKLKAGEYFN